MKRCFTRLAPIAIGFLLLASSSAFPHTTFFDGEFSLVNWTKTDLTSGDGTSTMSQPAYYMSVSNTINSGLLQAVHIFNTALYNPATSGGISTVNISFDTLNIAGTQAMQPVILQNGIFWLGAAQTSYATNSWETLAFTDLTANSFGAGPLQSTGLMLDFSSAGAPMTFGFSGANSDYYSTSIVGVDNFTVSVSAIPEPSTYAGALGLCALAMTRCRRRRQP